MAKRAINFKTFKENLRFNREIFSTDTFKRGITQKSGGLKRNLAEKRDRTKRDGTGDGRGLARAKTHKIAVAGVATLGAAAVAVSLAPTDSDADSSPTKAAPTSYSVASGKQIKDVHASITSQGAATDPQIKLAAAQQKDDDEKENPKKDAPAKKTKNDGEKGHKGKKATGSKHKKPTYPDNLDGWIRESLAVMKKHDIPGSYEGLYRNIIRESSGDPKAINLWDINAQNGIPSKGLLQVIPPTFKAYHVPGTSWNIYNPIANITAAANYAADRYGSMDNVNGPY